MNRRSHAVLLLVATSALLATPAHAVQRAFVASFGSDANAATNCGFTAPCRSFAAAVPVVDPGGEVLALDSIGYGAVTIDRSITITSAPGAYAGITVSGAGNSGVTIATAGVNVTLRGLVINNVGGSYGITMTNGSRLSVENCVISNFASSGGYAVSVNTAARVRIVDSLIRDNFDGVLIQAGATADVASSKFLGHSNAAIYAKTVTASTTTTIAVTDSVVTGSTVGIAASSTDMSAKARVSVIRTAVTNGTAAMVAISSSDISGTVLITTSDNMITGNGTAFSQSGSGSVIESLGNNTVRQNTTPVVGTLTPVAPM